MTPSTLDGVSVVSGVRIDERNAVAHGAVHVTQRLDIPIRSPAIADERSAEFDPSTDNVRQCVDCSAPYGNNYSHRITRLLYLSEISMVNWIWKDACECRLVEKRR